MISWYLTSYRSYFIPWPYLAVGVWAQGWATDPRHMGVAVPIWGFIKWWIPSRHHGLIYPKFFMYSIFTYIWVIYGADVGIYIPAPWWANMGILSHGLVIHDLEDSACHPVQSISIGRWSQSTRGCLLFLNLAMHGECNHLNGQFIITHGINTICHSYIFLSGRFWVVFCLSCYG